MAPAEPTVPIGEFARWTHLTVKALRHYHDVGVLVPVAVDAGTGYRRYAAHQLADAHLVRRLRDLDVPLPEVRRILDADGPGERERLLQAHLGRLERQLARTSAAVTSLRRLLDAGPAEPAVEVRTVPAVVAIVERAHVAAAHIEEWSGAAFARLADRAGAGAGRSGSTFGNDFFSAGAGAVTAFVTVTDPDRPDAVTIDGGPYAVTTHVGPYADLDLAYGALGAHVAALLPVGDGPVREHYLVGPEHGPDPSAYRTEVLWPLLR